MILLSFAFFVFFDSAIKIFDASRSLIDTSLVWSTLLAESSFFDVMILLSLFSLTL